MKYAELPLGYRIELDMLEPQARESIDSGELNDSSEIMRRYNLLTADVKIPSLKFGRTVQFQPSKWDYIPFDECYMVTAMPEQTPGVAHDEIIFREFYGFDLKRALPLNDNGAFVFKDFVIDRFYTNFCGDVDIDSEVIAYARKLRQALEVVPGIIFLSQNYEMLQSEI